MEWIQNFLSFGSSSSSSPVLHKSPPPTPSYRGTGATAARRPTITAQNAAAAAVARVSAAGRGWRPPLNPADSLVADRGLRNRPGENNCFLNAAVQVLWHVDVFRRSFRLFEGHTCIGEECIFCALKVVFTQYQHSEDTSIPPDILRNALANCYKDQDRFQLGLMDDAAECFEKLLERLHYHLTGTADLDSCVTPWCVPHAKFALTTVEQTTCGCGQSSEPLTFVEFVHYVSASVIKDECEKLTADRGTPKDNIFDYSLKAAGAIDGTNCQNLKCRRQVHLRRVLLSAPDAVCIGVIWDSDCPPISYIMSFVNSIGLKIHLNKIFDQVLTERVAHTEYNLTAMVTYYGRHYSTFCYHSVQKSWVYFDDARFRKVGQQWADVKEECRKAHFQPLLLIYTNPNSSLVDASEAPRDVTMVTTPTDTDSSSSEQPLPSNTAARQDKGKETTQSTANDREGPVSLPDRVHRQEETHVPDLMQFSVNPSQLLSQSKGAGFSSTANVLNNLEIPTGAKPATAPVSVARPRSDVITDDVNFDPCYVRPDVNISQRYKEKEPISYVNNPPVSLYPQLHELTGPAPYYMNVSRPATNVQPLDEQPLYSNVPSVSQRQRPLSGYYPQNYTTQVVAANNPFIDLLPISTGVASSAAKPTNPFVTPFVTTASKGTPSVAAASGRGTPSVAAASSRGTPSAAGGRGTPSVAAAGGRGTPSVAAASKGTSSVAAASKGTSSVAAAGSRGTSSVAAASNRPRSPTRDKMAGSSLQFEEDFKKLPEDLQLTLLQTGACLEKLPAEDKVDPIVTICLLGYASSQLKDVLDQRSLASLPKLNQLLRLKKDEIDKRSRSLKMESLPYPNTEQLAMLLSTKHSMASGSSQSVTRKIPLSRTPSPSSGKPPIARKPSMEEIESRKTDISPATRAPLAAHRRTPSPDSGLPSRRQVNSREHTPSPNHVTSRTPSPVKAAVNQWESRATPQRKCLNCHEPREVNSKGVCKPCELKWKITQ